ncbi:MULTISPECIES: hypothetical protein [unclassified Methylobacterium]|uniref:hypothetical protein n=1 Tax=unclassified Methylobacterium TaxID=2615210 RepID=UPI00226AD6DA|nr:MULTISPECIES: hypothetical protein [unclassified Methylobacterium]
MTEEKLKPALSLVGNRDAAGNKPAADTSTESQERAPAVVKTKTPADKKFRAKKINEHIKSAYSLFYTLSAAIIGGAFIIPLIKHEFELCEFDRFVWIGVGIGLHVFGHVIVYLGMQREDQ